MNNKNNDNKSEFLGMPVGTAQNRLRKLVLFNLLKKHNENICFQCKKKIEMVEELSIEHMKPWLYESVDLFWDMDNIAFSHLSCNSGTSRYMGKKAKLIHGNCGYDVYKCRCDICKNTHTLRMQIYRKFGTTRKKDK